MNRLEKSIAFVLGALVFFGLFFFIQSAMKNAPGTSPTEDAYSDYVDEEDLDVDEDLEADVEEEAPAPAKETPAAKTPEKK